MKMSIFCLYATLTCINQITASQQLPFQLIAAAVKLAALAFQVTALASIDFNKDCEQAIRSVGLPRVWWIDDKDFPLSFIEEKVFVKPITIFVEDSINTDNGDDPWDSDKAYNKEVIYQMKSQLMLACLHQDSPQLIEFIREKSLEYPDRESYNFSRPTEDLIRNPKVFGDTLAMDVENLIFQGKKKNGFFIEAGAHNFENGSTTAYFEVKHGWTGMLVEPASFYYEEGRLKHRNAISVQTCLSPLPRVSQIDFSCETYGMYVEGRVKATVDMECFPLYSLLQAVGNPTVNYFSLDVEGGEFQILQTVPWEQVDIEVMSIETHFAGVHSKGTKEELIEFLASKGFVHIPNAHKKEVEFLRDGEWQDIQNDLFVQMKLVPEILSNCQRANDKIKEACDSLLKVKSDSLHQSSSNED